MKLKTVLLIAVVLFFPLNHLPSFANETEKMPRLFDVESSPVQHVDEFISAFSAVSQDAMKYALSGYAALDEAGKLLRKDIITIVDFSKPSTQERLFVIDLKSKNILAKSLCAHGKNSGENWANAFSNIAESNQSSLGFYQCSETYQGKHGLSLRLDGLEKGINDNARNRGVVIHGADYVSKAFIQATGRLGRSQGCPALPMDLNEKIINLIKGGTCLFIYHPDKQYAMHSTVLKQFNMDCLAEYVADNFMAGN